jgi:hypothetical protein
VSITGALAAGLSFAAIPMLRKAVPTLAEKKSKVVLYKLNPPNDELETPGLRLQYFPEAIQDTRAVVYATRQVPGGSLPLYHWIAGGERTLSFSVVFSSDVDLSLDTVQDYKSEIKNLGLDIRNVDVKSGLLWLRSFMMPTYVENDEYKPLAPPKMLLRLPGSGIGVLAGHTTFYGTEMEAILCVMTQCDIEYRAFFSSGNPRFAVANVVVAQIPQYQGTVDFPGWDEVAKTAVREGIGGSDGGYNLTE